jgi:uncharacterized protein YcfJ
MHDTFKIGLTAVALAAAVQASAQVTFYEREGFQGRAITVEGGVRNLDRQGFNDRASSVQVERERWEVCEAPGFRGRCVVLRRGSYPSLAAMGLNNRVSSVRPVGRSERIADSRYAPMPSAAPMPTYDPRRRPDEPLYQAPVVAVRGVSGPPEQRCWIEREQVVQERGDASVPSAIAGAVIGGILGHQIGGGTGKDLATVGGAVAGAAVGANIGRDMNGQQVVTSQPVQRCAPNARPGRIEYWDVTYVFQGREHHVQTTTPPGSTITVNGRGEPRV